MSNQSKFLSFFKTKSQPSQTSQKESQEKKPQKIVITRAQVVNKKKENEEITQKIQKVQEKQEINQKHEKQIQIKQFNQLFNNQRKEKEIKEKKEEKHQKIEMKKQMKEIKEIEKKQIENEKKMKENEKKQKETMKITINESSNYDYKIDKQMLSDAVEFQKELDEIEAETGKSPLRQIKFDEISDSGTEICKNVYLGSAAAAANMDWLLEMGITHIVNCTRDVQCFWNETINKSFRLEDFPGYKEMHYMRVPIDDSKTDDVQHYFDKSYAFIDNALKNKNNKVLIHCYLGQSRSASITTAFVMRKYKIRYNDVLNLFDKLDYHTNINEGFDMKLKIFQDKLFNENNHQKRTRKYLQSQQEERNDEKVDEIINEMENGMMEEED